MHKSTCIATAAEIEQVIGKPIVALNVEEDGSSINLRQAHYNSAYLVLHQCLQGAHYNDD